MKKILSIFVFFALSYTVSAQTITPLCASTATTFGYEYVQSVTLNGVTFAGNTGFTGPGYYDYTATPMPIFTAGGNIPYSVVVRTNGSYQQYVKLWIDFNNNGNLEDAGELVFERTQLINNTTFTFSGNFAVPTTAFNGPVRMRLIMVYSASPQLCGNYSYGNTFDFGNSVQGGVNPVGLTVARTGTGNVISSPVGIQTASGFNFANFAENSNVILTATPTSPQFFTGWTGAMTSSTNPITVTMNVAKTLTANFSATAPPVTVAPTLTNFNNINKMYFDGTHTIVAPTSNSTGAFSYTSSNTAVATISGTTITILAPGTSTITANQAAATSYAAGSVTATLTVTDVEVLTTNGKKSKNNTNYINVNGKLGGNRGINTFGQIKTTKSN